MTLIFNKNGTPDNRQIEYEQDILRLGVERTDLIKEVDRAKADLTETQRIRGDVEREIEERKNEVVTLEVQLETTRKNIAAAVRAGSLDVTELRDRERESISAVENKQDELEKLNDYLVSLDGEIETKHRQINVLTMARSDAQKALQKVQAELYQAKREKESVETEVRSMYEIRKELNDSLRVIKSELTETEEIVSVLKSSNKEGLELVASFEGERQRLQAKAEFLQRKEDDLAVYEARLAKRRKEAGLTNEMTFN